MRNLLGKRGVEMKQFLQTAIANPKTTISGILSFVGLTAAGLIPFTKSPKVLLGLTVAAALAKLYMGAIQKDNKQP